MFAAQPRRPRRVGRHAECGALQQGTSQREQFHQQVVAGAHVCDQCSVRARQQGDPCWLPRFETHTHPAVLAWRLRLFVVVCVPSNLVTEIMHTRVSVCVTGERERVLSRGCRSQGNAQTVMICALAPGAMSRNETRNTLDFASRASKVENKVCVNFRSTVSAQWEEGRSKILERELSELRAALEAMVYFPVRVSHVQP